MNHDQLCPRWSKVWAGDTCDCYLIAKVREDERAKWEANGPYFTSVVHGCCEEKETAYQQGQRDMLAKCIAAVEAWALENPYEHPSPNRVIGLLRDLQEGL